MPCDTAVRVDVLDERGVVGPEAAWVAVVRAQRGVTGTCVALVDNPDQQGRCGVGAHDVAATRKRTGAAAPGAQPRVRCAAAGAPAGAERAGAGTGRS